MARFFSQLAPDSPQSIPSPASRSDMARERKRVSRLQKELERKEKALAEAAALLVLSKKAQAIWGVDGEA